MWGCLAVIFSVVGVEEGVGLALSQSQGFELRVHGIAEPKNKSESFFAKYFEFNTSHSSSKAHRRQLRRLRRAITVLPQQQYQRATFRECLV